MIDGNYATRPEPFSTKIKGEYMMKRLVLTGLLLGTLVGCGQQTSAQPQQHSHSTAPSKPQPQPPAQPQPPKNTDSQDFADYWNQLNDPFSSLQSDITLVSNLALEGANNPSELETQDYRDRVQQACDTMKSDAEAIEGISTPSNPKVAAISNEVLQGVEEVKYVATNLPSGVNDLNVTTINNCTQAFQNASSDFAQATTLIKDFNQGNN